MTVVSLDLIERSLRGDPDEHGLRAALERVRHATALEAADQGAVVDVLARVVSITPASEPRSATEHRRIARFLGSFGERVADVVAPTRPGAFADVAPGERAVAVALHERIRRERQFDVVAPILAAASMRYRHKPDQGWLVLAAVLEALLKLPTDLEQTDRRRLTWYGHQLFEFWLEPHEVALLAHARWHARVPVDELRRWWALVPQRRPFADGDMLAELVITGSRPA